MEYAKFAKPHEGNKRTHIAIKISLQFHRNINQLEREGKYAKMKILGFVRGKEM